MLKGCQQAFNHFYLFFSLSYRGCGCKLFPLKQVIHQQNIGSSLRACVLPLNTASGNNVHKTELFFNDKSGGGLLRKNVYQIYHWCLECNSTLDVFKNEFYVIFSSKPGTQTKADRWHGVV